MHKAFNAVRAYIAKNKIKGVTGSAVARKVFDAVIAGEHDAAKVADAIIKTLTAKKA